MFLSRIQAKRSTRREDHHRPHGDAGRPDQRQDRGRCLSFFVHHDSTLLTRLFSQPGYASALRVWVAAARGWLPIAGANRLRSCRCTTFLAGVTSWTLRQDNEQRDDYGGDDRRGQWAAQG